MLERFYKSPPCCENLSRTIRELAACYHQLKVFSIGKSLLGRDITALSIGNPTGATCFVGATHGLEWLTTTLLIKFCHGLLQAMASGGNLSEIDVGIALRSRSLVIIPSLNPDGVEIAIHGAKSAGKCCEFVECASGERRPQEVWQANAAGVDLNHNFDAGWLTLKQMEIDAGIVCPGPTRYGGQHPHSELETIAITTFCRSCQPRSLYSFHSQGEEIYWHYGPNTPDRSKIMAQILASSSGYELAKPAELASHGGLKDWFIEKMRRPAFTIEIGRGKNPLGLNQLESIYRKTEEMMMIAALL